LKLAKALVIIAGVSLLSAGVIGLARPTYAHDAQENAPEAGAWSADTQNPPGSSSEPSGLPKVRGCWLGTVDDGGEGSGTATFHFTQNGSTLVSPSKLKFFWNANNFVHGPISGSVSSAGIKFRGGLTGNCSITGSGTFNGNDEIDGTYTFHKACAQFFLGGTFTIARGC
jgi:hypothetical protein